MMTVPLRAATEMDLTTLADTMNAAFRGTAGQRGWSVESEYIEGDRTSESLLRKEIASGALYLLSKEDGTSDIQGCVCLQAISSSAWKLGSLAVGPALQNAGFGRKLLTAAEDYAASRGAEKIEITVVNIRDALISWYERRGYVRTGEVRSFPYGDNRFGVPKRQDLGFVVLERHLNCHGEPPQTA